MRFRTSGIEQSAIGIAQQSVFINYDAVLFEFFRGPALDTLSRERILWMVRVGFMHKHAWHVLYRERIFPVQGRMGLCEIAWRT
jgi:hypothetical protein